MLACAQPSHGSFYRNHPLITSPSPSRVPCHLILQRQRGNPAFSFLTADPRTDVAAAYYRFKLAQVRAMHITIPRILHDKRIANNPFSQYAECVASSNDPLLDRLAAIAPEVGPGRKVDWFGFDPRLPKFPSSQIPRDPFHRLEFYLECVREERRVLGIPEPETSHADA